MIQRTFCPYCQSFNVLSLAPQALILSGISGIIGGCIALLLAERTDLLDDKGKIGGVTFGVISGGAVGYRFGKGLGQARGKQLCLDCFHFFDLDEVEEIDGYNDDYYQ
ncbi:hypothetical protein FACS1894110_24380 [Spirochaetia bacterium]|nr:hypothetical protein FACS1894110_24380 [Spirochaetia bacterium]